MVEKQITHEDTGAIGDLATVHVNEVRKKWGTQVSNTYKGALLWGMLPLSLQPKLAYGAHSLLPAGIPFTQTCFTFSWVMP
jgi:hypothetical protein